MSRFQEATTLASVKKYETVSVAHYVVEHLVQVCNSNNYDDDCDQENDTSSDHVDEEHSEADSFLRPTKIINI